MQQKFLYAIGGISLAVALVFSVFFSVAFSVVASAKMVSIDSYIKKPGIEDSSSFCYVHKNREIIDGQRIRAKVKIASVTKLFTSFYVLKTLGPDYRFVTQLRYNERTKAAYILGSKDPYMGTRTLQFLVSELNRMGIRELTNLYFDENFAVYGDVEVTGNKMWSDVSMPAEVRYSGRSVKNTEKDLKYFLGHFRAGYEATRQAAESQDVKMAKAVQLKVAKVSYLPRENILSDPYTHAFNYHSSPVLRYVKDLNSHSNNYVADQLIAATGGIQKFQEFFVNNLGFTEDDFELRTGSGLWVNDPYVEGKERIRTANQKDNLATCEAVMNVIWEMNRFLKKKSLKLQDVVMVASQDRGTLNIYRVYKSEELSSSVLAKTGTLATANALAGEITAETGDYFFGIFFETVTRNALAQANKYRDQIVRDLMSELGGKNPVDYLAHAFLPFDKYSVIDTRPPLGKQ